MITVHNARNHEIIGLQIKALHSKNRTVQGVAGMVLYETMKTFLLQTRSGRRIFPKAGTLWRFILDGDVCEIEGDSLVGRPHERLVADR